MQDRLNVSVVAHELRNPLTALRAHTEILADSPRLDADDRESLAAIARASGRLERILDDLLELSRPRPAAEGERDDVRPPAAVPARSVAEAVDVTRVAAGRAGIRLDVDDPAPDLRAALSQTDLDRAVLNLVSNAVKFSLPGQRVRIEHGTSGGRVRIAVHDQGVGISARDLPQVFTPFFRAGGPMRPAPGSGLGLAIVKEIVDRAGGEVTVESTPDVGSTFTLWLPREERQRPVERHARRRSAAT